MTTSVWREAIIKVLHTQYTFSDPDLEGHRRYHIEDFPDETLSEDQVGESFVEKYFRKYMGKFLEDFASISMKAYQL